MPKARFSSRDSLSPVPSPAMTRPAATQPSARNWLRSTSLLTSPIRATRVPTTSASCRVATTESTSNGAIAGRSGDPIGHRWS